ncbi:glycosyltransferase family 2 protein [Actinopolymorpha singaporensis]
MAADVPDGDFAHRKASGIDVVICTYRSSAHVLACLDSLRASTSVSSTTVVDNASDDGTSELVADHCASAQVVRMGYNAGFARAVNRGLRVGNSRYVFVLNPDTVVEEGTLQTLLEFAELHTDAGVVAPRLVYGDGRDQLTARAFPTAAAGLFGRRSPLTRLMPNNRWSARYLSERRHTGATPFEVDWVSGAAMLLPRCVIDEVGGLDEGFFLFWEDADWCRRIKDAGYKVWCVPSAVVVHHEGGSRGFGWNPLTIRSFHRGAYRYWCKHHAPQVWNPLRWVAGTLLAGRAAALLARSRLSAPARSTDRRPETAERRRLVP